MADILLEADGDKHAQAALSTAGAKAWGRRALKGDTVVWRGSDRVRFPLSSARFFVDGALAYGLSFAPNPLYYRVRDSR